jgi:hypothetical protein
MADFELTWTSRDVRFLISVEAESSPTSRAPALFLPPI